MIESVLLEDSLSLITFNNQSEQELNLIILKKSNLFDSGILTQGQKEVIVRSNDQD